MRYFKRFSEFCGGFSAFYAAMFLLSEFMTYKFEDAMSMKEKLKHFFSEEPLKDYRAYLVLILLLSLSLAVSLLLPRLHAVGFAVAVVPLAHTLLMFRENGLYDRPTLHILLGLLYLFGFLADALLCDRADGRRRAYLLTTACGLLIPLMTLLTYLRIRSLSDIEPQAAQELKGIDLTLYQASLTQAQKSLVIFAVMLLISVAVSLLLRDIYFVDVIIAAVPAVYAVYYFFSERLPLFSTTVLLLSVFYFLCRLLLMTGEPMRKKR